MKTRAFYNITSRLNSLVLPLLSSLESILQFLMHTTILEILVDSHVAILALCSIEISESHRDSQ